MTEELKVEPKVRKDGLCVVCKGERKFGRQKGIAEETYLRDPFCSSDCARTYYGNERVVGLPGAPKRYDS